MLLLLCRKESTFTRDQSTSDMLLAMQPIEDALHDLEA